jgi:hypothetical protein
MTQDDSRWHHKSVWMWEGCVSWQGRWILDQSSRLSGGHRSQGQEAAAESLQVPPNHPLTPSVPPPPATHTHTPWPYLSKFSQPCLEVGLHLPGCTWTPVTLCTHLGTVSTRRPPHLAMLFDPSWGFLIQGGCDPIEMWPVPQTGSSEKASAPAAQKFGPNAQIRAC